MYIIKWNDVKNTTTTLIYIFIGNEKWEDDIMGYCVWAGMNDAMQKYHDNEWGVPVHDDRIMVYFPIYAK